LEKNNELPKGWATAYLNDVRLNKSHTVIPNKTKNKKFELYSVPSFSTNKPEIVNGSQIGSNKQTVDENTVLLCKINPRINRVWIVGNYSTYMKICSTEWIPFFKLDEILPKYFLYFFQNSSFREYLSLNVSGVGGSLTRINPSVLSRYFIPIAPLNEQRRIVSKIEELFSELDNVKLILEKTKLELEQYHNSLLTSIFEGELFNFEFKKIPLLEIFKNIHGKFLPKNKMEEGNIPVFGGNGIVGYHNCNNLEGEILVIGRVGANCGNIHYFSGRLWITDNTIGLIPKTEINLKFFLYQLKNRKLNKMSAGTGQPYISGKTLSELIILTTDIATQNKIVYDIEQNFSLLEHAEKTVASMFLKLDLLYSSILKQAFEGKLVPQDPNDEPASKLLKKIKSK